MLVVCRALLQLLVWSSVCVETVSSFGVQEHAHAVWEALAKASKESSYCSERDHRHEQHANVNIDRLQLPCDARPVFLQYLIALRHLLAFFAGRIPENDEGKTFLERYGELDIELSQLVSRRLDTYYFWHGPKRHVPVKFEELLGFRLDGQEVRTHLLAAGEKLSLPPIGLPPAEAALPLGLIYPTKAALPVDVSGIALVVGDEESDDICALSSLAVEAGIRKLLVRGAAARLASETQENAIKTCISSSLTIILDISEHVQHLARQSGRPFKFYVKRLIESLGLTSVTSIGLPATAWTDKTGYLSKGIHQIVEAGLTTSVSMSGAVSLKQFKKVLKQAVPPVTWLVQHDDCKPMSADALKMAAESELPILASGHPCGHVLPVVASKESMSVRTLLHRWTLELGMSVAFGSHVVDAIQHELSMLTASKALSAESWQLLSGSALLVRTGAHVQTPDVLDTFQIRSLLARGQELATSALQSSDTEKASKGHLSSSVWANLGVDQKAFDDNHFIIYKPKFLSDSVYDLVLNERDLLWKSADLEKNCNLDGRDRIGGYVLDGANRNASLYQLFYGSEEFRQWISRINGHVMFPSDFPIELREYPSGSKGMRCHRDLLMYTNATLDLEFVYTIDNYGSCISTYTDRQGVTHEVHTEANSLIMVRPEAAMHCVKPSTAGFRTILKFIYVGDYKKSRSFGMYTENECGTENPNVQVLTARRSEATKGQEL